MDEQLEADRVASEAPPVKLESETKGETTGRTATTIRSGKFIRVDRSAIVKQALEKLFDRSERKLAGEIVAYLCALRQAESALTLDKLVDLYDPFNSDDETVNLTELDAESRSKQLEALKAMVIATATSANYTSIDKDELTAILSAEYKDGFAAQVDLTEFDFHLLFYRGVETETHTSRSWTTLWLAKRTVVTETYRRLFIGLKLKPFEARVEEIMRLEKLSRSKARKRVKKMRSQKMLEGVHEETLHLKVFRNIPKGDLEILFPNVHLKFTLIDKLWLWVGSGGSTAFAIGMAVLKFVAAFAIINLYFIVVTLFGAVGAIVRTVMNVFNTRTRYMAKLAQHLYCRSIAANQSVLATLNDDAEEEDIKEAVLTYALLLRHGHLGLEATKIEAQSFLKAEFGVDCDFDIKDGCRHLRKLGLLVDDETGAPGIRNLEDARAHLETLWLAVPTAAA